MSAPAEWCELESASVVVASADRLLPVVTDDSPQNKWAARFLVQTVEEMTGRRLPLYVELKGQKGRWKEALFIGAVDGNDGWDCPLAAESAEAFRVVAADGAVHFLGRADYAVFDWCERALGLRFYCEGGKCVEKRAEIVAPSVDYADKPVFDCRQLSWQAPCPWLRVAKYGSSHRGGVAVHQPAHWFTNDAVKAEAPDIFETGTTPMLCYGNPATLDYYQRRIDRHIAGLEDSDGIVNTNRKVVTVCQWDAPIRCACRWCKPLYDEKLGASGNASPIIWGRFTKKLAAWLKATHPDYLISFLPYLNTCQVPRSLRPHPRRPAARRWATKGALPRSAARRGGNGPTLSNCEAELCTMPGVALLKDPDVRRREEDLIRRWRKVTGRKVLNWHYSCWPRDWTSAPYVFGKTIQRHYAELRDEIGGTYVCGNANDVRQALSHYVWMKCLWNPDVDVEAIYDDFARRMFGAGAAPMRALIRLQEEGWNRKWQGEECTYHNVFEVSYPQKDAEKMRELLVEAHRLATAAKDEAAVRRIVAYASGLNEFMLESDAIDGRGMSDGRDACRPSAGCVRRAGCPSPQGDSPDGRDARRPSVKVGETNEMVVARSVRWPAPWAKTRVTTRREGDELVFEVRCEEPAAGKMDFENEPIDDFVWGNDRIEIILERLSSRSSPSVETIEVDLLGRVRRAGCPSPQGDSPDGRDARRPSADRVRRAGCPSPQCQVTHDDRSWTAVVRVRLTAAELKAGKIRGNVCRWRVGDRKLPKAERVEGSCYEHSRLNTVYTQPNDDPAAFVEFLVDSF